MVLVRTHLPRFIAGLLVAVVIGAFVWMLTMPITTRVRAVTSSTNGLILVTDATGQRVIHGDTLDIESTTSPMSNALGGNANSVTVSVGSNGGDGSCRVDRIDGITPDITGEKTATGPGASVTCYFR